MANTKRTTLDLDNDALELLARLAPSADRQGKLVSDLIRAAAQTSPPSERAWVSKEITELNRQSLEIIQRRQARRQNSDPNVLLPMTPQDRQGLIDLLQSWIDEAEGADLAAGQASLDDFKQALNENRWPAPPLFP